MSEAGEYPTRRGPWVVTGSREIHRTPWVRVRDDQIIWPDKREATWTVIEFRPAVGIVAVSDDEQVHLVGQHRYAVDRYEWELPEGLVDDGEDPLAAAQRELAEETGLTARRWTPLGSMHPHNSSCDAIYHVFLAQDLDQGQAQPEQTEILARRLVPLADLVKMVSQDQILDTLTIVGVYRAWHYLGGPQRARG
jgi:8-oxo-dGDP phosphatase